MATNKLTLRKVTSPYFDFTKGSVLSLSELDNNFVFLKGQDILTGSTVSTDLILTRFNGGTINIDLSAFSGATDTNDFTTGSTLVGTDLVFDRTDALSAYTVDLSSLLDNTNFYTTGGTVVNKTIVYDRTDTLSAYTIDVSGLLPSTDYGNIIFVSEVGLTGQTRNDVIGDINAPVGLEWASQIAQSGDTIHVKSGVYNVTITGQTGLCVNGVNHYFEPGAKVYKSTSGPMFSKANATAPLGRNLEANVFGSGSFYGSGSCGFIFYNFAVDGTGSTQTYEWDICENSADACIVGFFNGDTVLRGKRRIISSGGDAIVSNGANLTIDCPIIKSTVAGGIRHTQGGGTVGSLKVNAIDIIGAAPSAGKYALDVDGHFPTDSFVVNANYVNYVRAEGGGISLINLTLNVGRVDQITAFKGTYLNVNGHLGFFGETPSVSDNFSGIADIKLIDRFWGGSPISSTGTINTTFNGDFNFTSDTNGSNLISATNGLICNYRLQKSSKPVYGSNYNFVDGWRFVGNGSVLNLLGQWDVQDTSFSDAGGVLNIPSETIINIGPERNINFAATGAIGATFAIGGTHINIAGTIVERCNDGSAPCDNSQSAHTYSNRLMYADTWTAGPTTSTRVVYNGATIIVRDQNSQILTTPTSGGTIGIYSGGLNTNKMNTFEAEQEKLRVSVTGTSASLTVNTEMFISTTGATAAASAAELVSLINASGTVAATASQDTLGTDTYIYVEADVAGDALTMVYNVNTLIDTVIRWNTKAITDVVGGTLIEDPQITRDLWT